MTQEIIQIVLDHGGRRRIIPFCKLVHIEEIAASQQVVHGFVVLGAVQFPIESGPQGEVQRRMPFHTGSQVEVVLVHMAFLKGIFSPSVRIVPVDGIEPVPVYMDCTCNLVLPGITGPSSLHGVLTVIVLVGHIEITREVTVVIRSRILCVVPVKGRVTVLSCPEKERRGNLELPGRCVIVLQESDGLIGYPVPGIAHLAVLVAPVGVVHVVSHQVVDFLGGSILCSACSRGSECDKGKPVDIAPVLLNSKIIGERTVINSLYPIVASKAGRGAHCVGPSLVVLGNCVGSHEAEAVQRTVGKYAEPGPRTDLVGGSVDVGKSVVASNSVRGYFGTDHGRLCPSGFVEAAPEGIRGITRQGVIHLHAGHIDILRLTCIAPYLETDSAEIVACYVIEHIVLVIQDRRSVLIAVTVKVEFTE